MIRWRLILAAVAWAPRLATAQESPIVIESYAGARPEDADALLLPLLEELEDRDYTSSAAMMAKTTKKKMSSDAAVMSALQLAEFVRRVDQGYARFLRGDFGEAVVLLRHSLAELAQYPGTLVEDQRLRDVASKAHLGVALSLSRMGNEREANASIGEFIRTFPDREISRSIYGPEPAEFARTVRAELDKMGRGALRVVTDEPAAVFLNERFVGVSKGKEIVLQDLHAGDYRVLVVAGQRTSRVHRALVRPAAETALTIDLSLDTAMHSDDRWVGLEYPGEKQRSAREFSDALALGRSLGAPTIVLVGVRLVAGRRSLFGAVLTPGSSKPVRVGAVAVPLDAAQARGLARFLVAGERAPDLRLAPSDPSASPPRPAVRRSSRWVKFAALGVGVVLAGAGAYLVAIHGDQACDLLGPALECPEVYDTRALGWASVGTGAALAGVGVVLWARETRGSSAAVSLRADDQGIAFGIAGHF